MDLTKEKIQVAHDPSDLELAAALQKCFPKWYDSRSAMWCFLGELGLAVVTGGTIPIEAHLIQGFLKNLLESNGLTLAELPGALERIVAKDAKAWAAPSYSSREVTNETFLQVV